MVQLPVDDHAAPHATAQRNVKHPPKTGCDALPRFAEGRDVGVVFDPHGCVG